jgi:DNA-binding GntR family transcriptional regulator
MTANSLAPLATKTIRTQAADTIRKSILEGTLRIGSRIVERRLAEQLGTSLTAVREALVQLEGEGLIVKKPNTTTHVISLDRSDVKQIFDVREVLECHAFELAAKTASSQDIDQLKSLHASAFEAARARLSREYVQADLRWHEAVWNIPDNGYLSLAIRRLVLPLFMYSALHMIQNPDFDLVEDCSRHGPLIAALETRKVQIARRAFLAALSHWRKEALASVSDRANRKVE